MIIAIGQLYHLVRSGALVNLRALNILLTIVISTLTFNFPFGICLYSPHMGKDMVFSTGFEGTLSCKTTFDFYKNGEFEKSEYCFGIDRMTGQYDISGDTILLVYPSLGDLGRRDLMVIEGEQRKTLRYFSKGLRKDGIPIESKELDLQTFLDLAGE